MKQKSTAFAVLFPFSLPGGEGGICEANDG